MNAREDQVFALPQNDEAALLAFVRRVLEEDGDITSSLVMSLHMTTGVEGVTMKVQRERARWFRSRGRNVPTMPGPELE